MPAYDITAKSRTPATNDSTAKTSVEYNDDTVVVFRLGFKRFAQVASLLVSFPLLYNLMEFGLNYCLIILIRVRV